MKTIYITLVSLLLSTFAIGQNETINGKITDEFNNGLERAWVLVVDADDQRYITGTVTDENGFYEIDLTEQGTFLLSAHHVSFESPRGIGILNNEPSNQDFEIINHRQLDKITILEPASIVGIYFEKEISRR
jgi:hypothetical protein